MTDTDDDTPAANALAPEQEDVVVVAQPSSWQARLILAGLAAFCFAVVWAALPPTVSSLAWGLAAYAVIGLVLTVGVILPLYAAVSGADLAWHLEPRGLRIVRRRLFWTRQRLIAAGDVRRLGIDLAPGGGPERLVVTVTLVNGKTEMSPSFDDPLDAEWFADALAQAFDVAAPANILPPGAAPRRFWANRPTSGAPDKTGAKTDIFH